MLGYFVEQDVIGHIESDLDDEETAEEGRMRVAIAFADLAGYTKLTEEAGEARAVDAVERFVEAVEHTLPIDARVIKTLGDEVMVVGADAGALTGWAVGLGEELPADSRRRRASASTAGRRCIATATTTAARSIARRAWSRGQRAARCS